VLVWQSFHLVFEHAVEFHGHEEEELVNVQVNDEGGVDGGINDQWGAFPADGSNERSDIESINTYCLSFLQRFNPGVLQSFEIFSLKSIVHNT